MKAAGEGRNKRESQSRCGMCQIQDVHDIYTQTGRPQVLQSIDRVSVLSDDDDSQDTNRQTLKHPGKTDKPAVFTQTPGTSCVNLTKTDTL